MKKVFLLYLFLLLSQVYGCALLGHTIQRSNEEYDNIIVNMGYRYKLYYQEVNALNKQKQEKKEPPEKVMSFEDWIQTQIKSEKQKKAVERYIRIHSSEP